MHALARHAHPVIMAAASLAWGCIAPNAPSLDAGAGVDASEVDAEPALDAMVTPAGDAAPMVDAAPFDRDGDVMEADDAAPRLDARLELDGFQPLPGSTARSCGAPDQALEPVDCTARGDVDAVCVFSNHCLCSEGFVCEGEPEGGECAPGVICVPE